MCKIMFMLFSLIYVVLNVQIFQNITLYTRNMHTFHLSITYNF
jgi:hypothetical protein